MSLNKMSKEDIDPSVYNEENKKVDKENTAKDLRISEFERR